MADTPINLSRFRKAKVRAERKRQADANAVSHGRTRAEKTRDNAEVAKVTRLLDHARRDDATDA
ncbi:DUF4169 family protein [Meridianimarinicoccus sp. MJW13]|uniref:DUF4169 family protein n=1 Tax=Meridianimarinicoccus sp. MJW13 TaxID=2720031 RepID=UPI00186640B7|nr:DUF4169 family protein [Fluviibacterium sp. MJW13]